MRLIEVGLFEMRGSISLGGREIPAALLHYFMTDLVQIAATTGCQCR